MTHRIAIPCLTIEQCAQAMKMEHIGFSTQHIAEAFKVSRNQLVLTLYYAREFGFAYFAYQGALLDHLDTLRALGGKRWGFGIYDKFIEHTGHNITREAFTAVLGKIRPFL